jgi:hypothetical protein
MSQANACMDKPSLGVFDSLRSDAIDAVSGRFYAEHAQVYEEFGERGRQACREDLAYHLDFLRPVLEFGDSQPLVDYLHWLAEVLQTRGIPSNHLEQSLEWLSEFFAQRMEAPAGPAVQAALGKARASFVAGERGISGVDARMPAPKPECEEFKAALLAGDRAHTRRCWPNAWPKGRGWSKLKFTWYSRRFTASGAAGRPMRFLWHRSIWQPLCPAR